MAAVSHSLLPSVLMILGQETKSRDRHGGIPSSNTFLLLLPFQPPKLTARAIKCWTLHSDSRKNKGVDSPCPSCPSNTPSVTLCISSLLRGVLPGRSLSALIMLRVPSPVAAIAVFFYQHVHQVVREKAQNREPTKWMGRPSVSFQNKPKMGTLKCRYTLLEPRSKFLRRTLGKSESLFFAEHLELVPPSRPSPKNWTRNKSGHPGKDPSAWQKPGGGVLLFVWY